MMSQGMTDGSGSATCEKRGPFPVFASQGCPGQKANLAAASGAYFALSYELTKTLNPLEPSSRELKVSSCTGMGTE